MTRTFALKGKIHPKLIVPSDKELHQRFIVSFKEHFDALEIRLATFSLPQNSEDRFYACRIQSLPCCSEPIPEQEVEGYVFAVLNHTLPRGRWVIVNWSREKAVDTSCASCRESAISSLKRPAPEEDLVTPRIVTDAEHTRRSKRTRTEIPQQEEAEGRPQDVGSAAETAIDERIRGPAESLAKRFVDWLNKRGGKKKCDDGGEEDSNAVGEDGSDNEEEGGDDGGTAIQTRDFVTDLIDYHHNDKDSDQGQKLEEMMKAEMRRIAKARRQALWRLWYSRICVQLLRLSEDPFYSETDDCHKERVERHKRHACLILNGIVNGLWTDLRQRALLFYQFLAETNVRVTKVSRLEQSLRQKFTELVLDKLSSIKFPESPHVPHPAVAVAWLRSRKYETVCNVIGLHNLAHLDMDPEVAARESRLLNGGVDSVFEVSVTSRCWAKGSQKEEEIGVRSVGRAGNDEQQHHSPQFPGTDHAGDISVTTTPAPHDSPAAPVDSESGAGSRQANPLRRGEDAAATGTSCDHAPMQEPWTINAGPQGCDAGAHSLGVPASFKLLLAAAGGADEIERPCDNSDLRDVVIGEEPASANPGQERGQHAEPAPLGLTSGAVVENAASRLQCHPLMPSVGNEIGQPTGQEWTEGMGIATCTQVSAGGENLPAMEISRPGLAAISDGPDGSSGSFQAECGAQPEKGSDFMQHLSPGQWDGMDSAFDSENTSFLQFLSDPGLFLTNYWDENAH